jgi:hypothetical protein
MALAEVAKAGVTRGPFKQQWRRNIHRTAVGLCVKAIRAAHPDPKMQG